MLTFYVSSNNFTLIPPGGFGRDYDHNLLNRAARTVMLMTVEKLVSGGVSYGVHERRTESLIESITDSIDNPFFGVGMLKYQYRPMVHHVFGEIIYQSGYIFMFLCIPRYV